MRTKTAIKRKICSRPDNVCLQGGCGYCRDGRWRKIETLEKEFGDNEDFQWGLRNDFANAQVKYDDGSLKHE